MEKKPERSIAALEDLRLSGLPAVLVVAGDGPLRARLARRAAGLPVRFTGFVHDRVALAALLATADVVLAPGPVETFGLAALEALACGTPVVVSGSSALPEMVGEAGVAVGGEDFAAGVSAVLAWPAAERRAAARRRAEEFGWPAAVLRPSLAAVVAGVNDTLRRGFDAARVGAALAHTVGALSAAGATVLTIRLPDPGRMSGCRARWPGRWTGGSAR